jgi:hypothetical protein
MRKLDLAVLLLVVASASAWWTRKSSPRATGPVLTRSGRYQILPPPYGLAGLPIGSDEKTAETTLGKPNQKNLSNEETHSWSYERDGQTLNLTFLDGRLIAEGGTGRWSFEQAGQPSRTWFRSPQADVTSAFGSPGRTDESGAAVYPGRPGELTFHFDKEGLVEQVWITGEVKPLDRQQHSSRN